MKDNTLPDLTNEEIENINKAEDRALAFVTLLLFIFLGWYGCTPAEPTHISPSDEVIIELKKVD